MRTRNFSRRKIPGLQVQTLRSDNVTSDLRQTLLKLIRQLLAAHDLAGLRHLAQKLFKAAEQTDEGAFVRVRHFATNMLVILLLQGRG